MADSDHAFLVEESQSREANEFDVKIADEVLEEEAAKINPNSWAMKPEPMKEDPQNREGKKSRAKKEHLLQQTWPAGWKKKSSPKKKSKPSPKKRKSESSAPPGRPAKRTRKRGGN